MNISPEQGFDLLEKLSKLGMIAVLILIIAGLVYYIWIKDKSSSQTESILAQLADSNDRIATAFEHQNTTIDWLKEELSHHREATVKVKDGIAVTLHEVQRDVKDIKMGILSGQFKTP